MHKDPTIVHAVADLRREALLAEATSVWRTTPASATRKRSRAGVMVRSLWRPIAAAVSWLVDEFEPVAGVTRDPKMTPMA